MGQQNLKACALTSVGLTAAKPCRQEGLQMCRETWGREDRVWETLKGAMTGWDVDCSCSGVKINVQSLMEWL